MVQRISNKLAEDRIQIVFPGEPISDDWGGAEYGSEQQIQASYHVDVEKMKTEIQDLTGGEITVTDASIGIGAPMEGWLVDIYKAAMPVVRDVVVWVGFAAIIEKLISIAVESVRDSQPDAKPILSNKALEALAVRRFARFRNKKKYLLRGSQLYYGQAIATYEPWDVFMVSIAKKDSNKVFVVFIDCFGNYKGKASFSLDLKYGGDFGYD